MPRFMLFIYPVISEEEYTAENVRSRMSSR